MTTNTHPGIIFNDISSVDGKDFEALYEIYCEAIPSSERKSLSKIREMTSNPAYYLVAGSVEGQIIGFTIVYVFRIKIFHF